MRYLRNLASQQTYNDVLPWQWQVQPPEAVRKDKEARTRWATAITTRHHCYSAYEGLNEQMRVTRARGEEGNPPFKQLGFVVDFDAPWTREGLLAGLERVKNPPAYLENTLSGNARLVWTFAEPLLLPGYEFTSEWVVFLAEKLQVQLLLPGIDQGALRAPERYYTNSGDWRELSVTPVPSDVLRGWFVEFSNKFSFKGKEYGEELPIEQVIELLRARHPRFHEWPGDFAVGAQGPSFWVAGSTSPNSAIVKPGGMITFAAHASKVFYPWSELCGVVELDQSKAKTVGKAVENIFFDGKQYFRRLPSGCWRPFDKSDLTSHLRVTCKLSPRMEKNGGPSQLDLAVQHIQDHQYVTGAAPFVFRRTGLINVNGNSFLNTSTRRVLVPAEGPVSWGPEGQFPWISQWLDTFFDPASQKEAFLAWLSYYYRSAHDLAPRSGQNAFLAGGAGIGKTLLNRRVIGPLLGGYAEAANYLLGKDSFGAELFESGHWVIDDDSMSTTVSDHKKFSAFLKQMAANSTFRYHAKFRQPLLVEWCGRVVVTCNADEESIRILPDLSMTILDKLMLFRARVNNGDFRFPAKEVLEPLIDRELPFFARWLLDHKIPAHLMADDPRFGIMPYHNAELVSTANHSSHLAGFVEIIHDWKQQWFGTSKFDSWEGSSFQLHRALHADPTSAPALRNITVDAVGRNLSAMKNRGDDSISCREDEHGLRLWKISRPGTVENTQPEHITVGKTKFEK